VYTPKRESLSHDTRIAISLSYPNTFPFPSGSFSFARMIETCVVTDCSSGQRRRKVTAFNCPFGEISSEVVTFRQGCSSREQPSSRLKESSEMCQLENLTSLRVRVTFARYRGPAPVEIDLTNPFHPR